jgi:uncharacterized membrane protein YfcA
VPTEYILILLATGWELALPTMSISFLIIAAVAILAVATVFSMVGLGGGILYVPIFLALGMPFREATITSLFVIMVGSVSAAIIYYWRRFADWKLALAIEPPTFAMAFAAGFIAHYINVPALKILFAAILILAGYLMLRPAKETEVKAAGRWGHWHRRLDDNEFVVNLPFLMPVTAAAGFVAGLLGIAGGVLKVPAMVLGGGVPMRIAVGTSALMVTATAFAGFCGHLPGGHFQPWVAIPLAAVAFFGGHIGSRLSVKTEAGRLRKLFAMLLFLTSVWMVISAIM